MTKQEIEKAIENGESVWYVLENNAGVLEIKDRLFDEFEGDYLFTYHKLEPNIRIKSEVNRFFKTKAEAEHYLHHANVTRTETLLFLTWEEFKSGEEVIFKGRNGTGYALFCNKCLDKIDLFDTDGIMLGIIESWDLTEANFYKAYDECVRLFRGEE